MRSPTAHNGPDVHAGLSLPGRGPRSGRGVSGISGQLPSNLFQPRERSKRFPAPRLFRGVASVRQLTRCREPGPLHWGHPSGSSDRRRVAVSLATHHSPLVIGHRSLVSACRRSRASPCCAASPRACRGNSAGRVGRASRSTETCCKAYPRLTEIPGKTALRPVCLFPPLQPPGSHRIAKNEGHQSQLPIRIKGAQ